MWQIKIPKTEATVKEATLAKWHKREGEKVAKGEVIAEVETFKAIIEIISPGDGIFFKRMVDESETIPINTVIAVLAEEDEDISPETLNSLSEAKRENTTAPASKGVLIKGEQGPSDTPTDVSHVADKNKRYCGTKGFPGKKNHSSTRCSQVSS